VDFIFKILNKIKGGKKMNNNSSSSNPATFNVTLQRNKNGSFTVKAARTVHSKGKDKAEYRKVNARAFTRARRNNKILGA
jgi:hypothetical protein